MTVTLKVMLKTCEAVTLDLRVALKGVVDPIKTIDRLNRMIIVARISPFEALATGREALRDIERYDEHAKDSGRDELSDLLYDIASDLRSALTVWYRDAQYAEKTSRKNWDRGDVENECVGRWESRGGAHWAELWRGRFDYSYRSGNAGGSLCNPNVSVESAVAVMESRIARGCFLPDNAVLPMKRI
jgi:hypothetical protein